MTTGPARLALLLPAALLAIWPAGPALAQGNDAGLAPLGKLTIGQQISLDDGDLIGIMPLDLELRSGTRIQTLQFSMSLPVHQGDPEESNFFSLKNPQARLLFRRGVRNSSFETSLSYRENDIDDEIFYDQETGGFVTLDRGRVATTSARAGYAFGSQARLGGEMSLSYLRRDYTNTTDPDLNDSETRGGDLRLYLEPTPQIRARLVAAASRTDSDGGTDSRSDRLGVGASMQIDKLTNLDLELARSDIRRERSDGSEERSEGPSWTLGLSRAMPAGDWTLSFGSNPGTAGRRDNLMLGHSLERRGMELSASIGATRFRDNYDPIFQIGYSSQPAPETQISASLRRAGTTDDDGDEAINTDVSASFSRQMGRNSSLGTNIRYRESEVQSGNRQDARTMSLGINYNYALMNDISLVAGANVVRSKNQNGTRDDDERVWLGLSRSFDWLP